MPMRSHLSLVLLLQPGHHLLQVSICVLYYNFKLIKETAVAVVEELVLDLATNDTNSSLVEDVRKNTFGVHL